METSRRKFLQLASAVAGLGVLKPKELLAEIIPMPDPAMTHTAIDTESAASALPSLPYMYIAEAKLRGFGKSKDVSFLPIPCLAQDQTEPKHAEPSEALLRRLPFTVGPPIAYTSPVKTGLFRASEDQDG